MDHCEKDKIVKKIYECLDEYKAYVQFDGEFPQFEIEIENDLSEKNSGHGYKVNAFTKWDGGTLTLYVPEKMLEMYYQPLLFHEFTHIKQFAHIKEWAKKYGVDEDGLAAAITGYSEYCAYQIELLKCNGIDFKDIEKIQEEPLCKQYDIDEIKRRSLANLKKLFYDILQKISQENFPKNREDLDIVFGMLFQYWGYRSIYKMCGGDWEQDLIEEAPEKISEIFGEETFNQIKIWNDTLYGVLNDDAIA